MKEPAAEAPAEFAGTRNDEQHRYPTTTRSAQEIAGRRVLGDGGACPERRVLPAEHRGRPEGGRPSGRVSEALPMKVALGELAVVRKDEGRGDA